VAICAGFCVVPYALVRKMPATKKNWKFVKSVTFSQPCSSSYPYDNGEKCAAGVSIYRQPTFQKVATQVMLKGEVSMPIYEYKCAACGQIFEILTTSGTQKEAIRCRNCQSEKVDKILSAGSFRRGTGTPLPVAVPAGCGNKSGFS
jgi:putative FmdB family regulatory protein